MAPPPAFEPTRRLPGESATDFYARVAARARVPGSDVVPPALPAEPPAAAPEMPPAPAARVLSDVPFGPATAESAAMDAVLAAAQADASARVPERERGEGSAVLRGIGAVAGFIAGKAKAALGRVYQPKIWKADIKVPLKKRVPPRNWLRDVVADYAAKREKGDPLAVSFQSCMGVMLFYANDARGFFQRAIRSLAKQAWLSHETFRKCLRWSERNGWVGTLGANYREKGEDGVTRVRRDANVYQLFGSEDAAQFEGLDESARVEKRVSLTLSRGLTLWGHHLWPWGLSSRSPSAPRDRRNPAPT